MYSTARSGARSIQLGLRCILVRLLHDTRLVTCYCRFGALQAVDVSGVEPAIHARQEGVVLRQDEPRVYDHRWVRGVAGEKI